LSNINEIFRDLEAIGFRVTYSSVPKLSEEPDIERTIVKSLYHIDEEGRLLGLIITWLKIHGTHLMADKLFKEYDAAKEYLGETPWFSGICSFMYSQKDHRFKKGVVKLKKPHHLGNRDQSSLVKLKGPIEFLESVGILAAETSLRIRESDVLTVDELVRTNRQYRNRYIFGANWRAEIITSIQNGAQNPNQVSKLLGIARSRVGIVFKEYSLIKKYI
jgi:hypothetical protein